MTTYGALAFALCCCAAFGAGSALETHEEALIGWRGETYSAQGKAKPTSSKDPWVQQVSWRPRAYLYHNLLNADEARHLRSVAAPQMKRSTVVGVNGSDVLDSYRTSYGTFIDRLHDATVVRIMSKVAEWTRIPTVHQEDMQVLRYGVGQKYGAHMDSLIDDSPRLATVLIYLADTEEGGETAFPDGSEWISDEVKQAQGDMSSCTAGRVAVKPRLGDALLFFSIKPDGTHEPASMHTGCPVIAGQKWTATVWVHSQPFRPRTYVKSTAPPVEDPALCKDANDKCAEWAKSGECEKNPTFMTGATGCRKSCKACEACEEGDLKCWTRNREMGGYLVYNTTTFY